MREYLVYKLTKLSIKHYDMILFNTMYKVTAFYFDQV